MDKLIEELKNRRHPILKIGGKNISFYFVLKNDSLGIYGVVGKVIASETLVQKKGGNIFYSTKNVVAPDFRKNKISSTLYAFLASCIKEIGGSFSPRLESYMSPAGIDFWVEFAKSHPTLVQPGLGMLLKNKQREYSDEIRKKYAEQTKNEKPDFGMNLVDIKKLGTVIGQGGELKKKMAK